MSNAILNRSLVQRIYLRTLRHLGLKKLSWDKQFESGVSIYGPRSENTLQRVQELCRGGRMLEFGCGEGDLPFALPAGTYSSYMGYDISEVAIERARHRAMTAGTAQVGFQQCDMSEWRSDDPVSLILAEECLYYLSPSDTKAFLSRCLRCLAPDGSLLVIVHSATKHAQTLDICRHVCRVHDEEVIGGRVFLTLKSPRQEVVHPPKQDHSMEQT